MAQDDFTFQAASAAPTGTETAWPLASHNDLKQFRIGKRESQEKFWSRFGVTQSSGSRFETGLGIPAPVAILVKLYMKGRLSDGDLLG
ncbi:MAG: helix-turn-helix transcriptional regulator [Pseudomonadota bacterium]